MSQSKSHIAKGDTVEVTTGAHKGARGTVLQVINKTNKRGAEVLVEGVHMIKKAVRPSQDNPQGGFVNREAPVHISNVKVIEHHEAAPKKGKK